MGAVGLSGFVWKRIIANVKSLMAKADSGGLSHYI